MHPLARARRPDDRADATTFRLGANRQQAAPRAAETGAMDVYPRRRWRYPVLGAAAAALLVAAFAAGFVLAPSNASSIADANGTGLLPARGWNVYDT
jgi:hypothetical protein